MKQSSVVASSGWVERREIPFPVRVPCLLDGPAGHSKGYVCGGMRLSISESNEPVTTHAGPKGACMRTKLVKTQATQKDLTT